MKVIKCKKISKLIKSVDSPNKNWFEALKSDNIKYIVFKNLIIKYSIGN
jgi:hypothetical protein